MTDELAQRLLASVNRIESKVAVIDERTERQTVTQTDHERRLRALERLFWGAAGVLVLLNLVAPYLSKLVP